MESVSIVLLPVTVSKVKSVFKVKKGFEGASTAEMGQVIVGLDNSTSVRIFIVCVLISAVL